VNGELHTAAEAVYGRCLTHLYLRIKYRSCYRRLNNFREFRAFKLITESQSHFERSKRVKRFIEVSPRRRRPKLCRARRIQRTRRGMHFAVVADKIDLSSTKRRLENEKYNFYGVVNKLVYVTPTVWENCAHFHLIFDFSTFLCFKHVSEGHFLCRVIRRNGNYK